MTWYRARRYTVVNNEDPSDDTSWLVGYYCWLGEDVMQVDAVMIQDKEYVLLQLTNIELDKQPRMLTKNWVAFEEECEIPL